MRSVKLKRAKATLAMMLDVEPTTSMAALIDLVDARFRVVIDRKPTDKQGMANLLISMSLSAHTLKPRAELQ